MLCLANQRTDFNCLQFSATVKYPLRMEQFGKLIGKNIRRLRERANMSQEDLAIALGWEPESRSRISVYEKGSGMNESNIQQICKALKCEYWELTLSDNTPVISDAEEAQGMVLMREAMKAGIHHEIVDFVEYRLKKAQSNNAPAIPLRRRITDLAEPPPSDMSDEARINRAEKFFADKKKPKAHKKDKGKIA